jgi:RHS repeat-associated protein
MFRKLAIAAALATVLISCTVSAQIVGTGAYPFASFDTPGFDSINLGNLNTRFSIPITQKAGRGLPFSYILQYEGLVWSPVVGTGTTTWVPSPSWGFTGLLNGTGFAGSISYAQIKLTCDANGSREQSPYQYESLNFVYHDGFGANHPFTYKYIGPCSDGKIGATSSGSMTASDGSGYTLLSFTQVQTRNGVVITPSSSPSSPSAMSETDSNGNTISYGGTNGIFTDTTGHAALTISGSGPVTFTYPVVNQSGGATTASATLYYKSYTVQTDFGCSGIVEYGATTVNLVDHITLADGSEYAFTYESTPGTTDGAVTGRLASIMLPTGGAISYAYSGGCSSAGGIMADGTTAGLSRTTSDSANARTYNRGSVNANATSTTLTDQKGNQSVFQFTNDAGDYYETHRQVYEGSASGTPLYERFTCYNGASTPCDGAALTAQITATTVTEDNNGGSQAVTSNSYDMFGDLLSTQLSSSGSLIYKTTNTYNTLSELTASTTTDSSNNVISAATYGYDETTPTATSGLPQHVAASGTRGNQTSAHSTVSGSNTLSTTTAYYDTGMPVSTTTPNGTTSYTYDPTQTFVTQTALPTPSSGVALSTSWTYDAASGAMLTSTGMNAGQTTTVNTYDGLLRPTTISQPSTGQLSYTYTPTQTSVNQIMNSSTGETAEQAVLYDAYGRPSRQEVFNGQSTNSYYQADTCYDATGLPNFVSLRYQSTGFSAAKQCSGTGTSYVYDALGRPTSVTTIDGTATTQYTNRAVLTTDVNGVQKITQYDVLGRITGVCEITSTALNGQSPTACGMDIPGTGFVTSYAYALATHTTTVTQGAQTRTFVTDDLGRTTSVTEPERGNTTYSYTYNSTGLSVVRTRPRANQSSASTLTQTTTQYDSLGRPVSVSYSDGTAVAKNYYYDVLPSNSGWSTAPTNPKGMLVGISSGVSGSSLAGSEFSYDLMGNVTAMWTCGPSICGGSSQSSRELQYSYDLGNNLTKETDPTSGAISYGLSPAGEVTSIINGTYELSNNTGTANLVSNVVNGPFGPTSYSLGNGLSTVQTYDSLGRNNGGWVCSGSTVSGCTGGTQLYGNTANFTGTRMTSGCDTILNQCQGNSYDAMNRLIGITDNSGSSGIGSFSYTYDRWGNRLSQTATSGSGSSPSGAVNAATNQLTSVSYDAAGNQEGDGISHTFTYDAEGNVTAVDNGSTATYVYDALNHRVKTATSAGTYEYMYDAQGRRTSTWQASDNFGIEGRMYWGNKQIAFRNGPTFFEDQNYLGTERMRSSYQGALAATEVSLPYGDDLNQTVSISGSDQDNNQFAGQEYDSESGSQHAQFRQYSSTQGRWMSPDPYDGSYNMRNPQSLNRYSYVLNNPVSFTDPLGLILLCYLAPAQSSTTSTDGGPAVPDPIQYWQEECDYYGDGGGGGDGASGGSGSGGGGAGGAGGSAGPPPPSKPTVCPAVPFNITGVGPNQAPGTTAITQTPRSQIPTGGVAIKLDNFRSGSLAGSNWRPVIEGITLTVAWAPGQAPAGIPTVGPYSPVDTISANGVVSTGAPNQIDVYGYISQSQAFASTRNNVMVTATIPANNIGVRCPVAY